MPDDSLAIKPKLPSFKKGIAATREQSERQMKDLDPKTVPNRLGLIFDDSGSMGGDKMNDAKSAIKNFTLSCNPLDTSIAVYPLNMKPQTLTINFDLLNIYVMGLEATGGTPLYTKLLDLLDKEPITRVVVFSDGSPTDCKLIGTSEAYDSKPKEYAENVVKLYNTKELHVDTIYLGEEFGYRLYTDTDKDQTRASGFVEMQELARRTGGIFIHFKDSSILSKNLKYLAPKFRALLMNSELKEKIQKGRVFNAIININ